MQIQQRFSTIQLGELRRLCDASYEGEVYHGTPNEPDNWVKKECTSPHRITNFTIRYCGPEGSDPHHGLEGMRIEVEGVCYKRRTSLHTDLGVEFVFEGALVSEEDLESVDCAFGPHVETYKRYLEHAARSTDDNVTQSRTHWKWLRDERAHLTDPENVIPGCPICVLLPDDEQLKARAKKERNKSEATLREILQELFGKQFPNIRPSWLKNPDSGAILELDCYCKELNLAFEYQGRQHFEPVSFFGGADSFESQKIRDEHKREICKERGVTLVEIDGRVYDHNSKKAMKKHVKTLLKKFKVGNSK